MTQPNPTAHVVLRSVGTMLATGIVMSTVACTPSGDFVLGSRNATTDGPVPIASTPASEPDVEAPEVFDVTDAGLWDGRPSLGGVWVAHPAAVDPERVIIRHAETGRFVIGALFRRERENPGPPIQVSSEAAAALDLLAGAPADLQVTALRHADPEPDAAPEAAVVAEGPVTDDGGSVPTETAPIETAEAEAGVPTVTAATPEASAMPEPPRAGGGFLAAVSRVLGTAATPVPQPEPAATAVPATPRNMTADAVASGIEAVSFSTEALPPLQPVAARTDETAAPASATAAPRATPLPPPPAGTLSEAARVPAPARSGGSRSDTGPAAAYVQAGLFTARENAEAAGQALRTAGLVPTIRESQAEGRRTWRVVVGPAPTEGDRAAVLETVRGAGFADAYVVSR